MTRQPGIPLEIQAEVQKLVEEFNQKKFKKVNPLLRALPGRNANSGYSARFKGKYLYLARADRGQEPEPICRLTWAGAMDKWDFAIYKYSDERYDPDEWFFPGSGKVDGTVMGAMEAGLEAYPV